MVRHAGNQLLRGIGMVLLGVLVIAWVIMNTRTAYASPGGPLDNGAIISQATALPQTPQPLRTPIPEGDQSTILGDQVVSGSSFTLHANEVLRGDLTVFGGSAVLEEGSRVEGRMSLMGGSADVYGTVTGGITVVGGSLRLRPSAQIDGGLHTLGGTVNRDNGAQVRGQSSRISPPVMNRVMPFNYDLFEFLFNLATAAFAKVIGLVLITLIAIAIVTLFPNHTSLTAGVVKSQWLVAGSIGILTFITVPIMLLMLSITICLIPAAVVIALAWVVAIVFGWVISARVIGELMVNQLHIRTWNLLAQTVLGVVTLGLLGMLPIVGWLFGLLASAVGMGALLLCRGGTRNYPDYPAATPSLPTSTAAM